MSCWPRRPTNEPSRLVGASIGLALPAAGHQYGYISEHHGYGMTEQRMRDFVEDMAATMLATTLGIEFDPETAYDQRKEIYHMSGKIIKTRACADGRRRQIGPVDHGHRLGRVLVPGGGVDSPLLIETHRAEVAIAFHFIASCGRTLTVYLPAFPNWMRPSLTFCTSSQVAVFATCPTSVCPAISRSKSASPWLRPPAVTSYLPGEATSISQEAQS